jgi:hypothetical protein
MQPIPLRRVLAVTPSQEWAHSRLGAVDSDGYAGYTETMSP